MVFGVFVELLESNTSNVLRWIIRKITLASLLGSLFGFAFWVRFQFAFGSLLFADSSFLSSHFPKLLSDLLGSESRFFLTLCHCTLRSLWRLRRSIKRLTVRFFGDFLRSLLSFSLCFAFHRFGGKKRSFSADSQLW